MHYDKKYLPVILCSVISSLAAYGYALFNFTISIDGEYRDNFSVTISLGRWLHSLLKLYILPEPYVPFATVAFGLFIFAFSSFIISITLFKDIFLASICSVLFFSIPQLAYQIQFINQADTVAISFLLGALSAWLILVRDGNKKNVTLSILCMVGSISIYQSMFNFVPLIAMCYVVSNRMPMKQSLRLLSLVAVLTLVSIGLYFILNKIAQLIFDINASSYLSQTVSWGNITPSETISFLYRFTAGLLSFDIFYGINVYTLAILVSLMVAVYLFVKGMYVEAIMMPCIAFMPFVIVYLFGANQAPRTFTAAPVAFSFILTLALSLINKRTLSTAASFGLLCSSSVNASALFHSDFLARQYDVRMASAIVNAAESVQPSISGKQFKIYFYGGSNGGEWNKLPKSNVFGSSFFAWDGGNTARIASFISSYGIANTIPAPRSFAKKVKKDVSEMNVWPAKDSIRIIDNVVVVKIGEKAGSY